MQLFTHTLGSVITAGEPNAFDLDGFLITRIVARTYFLI